ncbi:MAG: hypothetical protein H6835_10365 [Planctomycetes bacterium]|nr:hypothetical protein [Planctomycetota bacterium]
MKTTRIAVIAASLVAMFSVSCSVFDPTYGMTEEQKTAYHAEQAAKAEQRRIAREEFEKKNVKDLNVAGEGHDEARDAQVVGRYECKMTLPVGEYAFLFGKKKPAVYKKHKQIQFFANGSWVEQSFHNYYESTDGKQKQGSTDTSWSRGMWKTDGDQIMIRDLTPTGMNGWHLLGKYQVGKNGSRKLLAVGREAQNIAEALLVTKNEEGKVNDPRQLDLWASM